MLAVELEKSDVKGFMGKLLREEIFDSFEARSVEIVQRNRITIDGTIEKEGFSVWSELRPLVFEIIKSGAKPSFIKIVFSQADPENTHPNAAALFLNMVYENDGVAFTTATSQKEFSLNKSVDDVWEDAIQRFFEDNGVKVTDRG